VNNQNRQAKVLVRILLAPKLDERGRDLHIVEQKNLFIEIDKFIVDRESFLLQI